jgi:CRP/FNR family cyclic AMP-dependent transcriptional regulator
MMNPAMNLLPPRFKSFQSLGDATPFAEKIRQTMDHIDLLGDFEAEEALIMSRYMTVFRVEAGSEVISEGETGEFMLLMLDGVMSILKRDQRGLPVQISEVSAGKSLGEMSVIDGGVRFASCVAKTTVSFAVLDRNQVRALVADYPIVGAKLMMHLLQLLNQRLRNVSDRLMDAINASQRNGPNFSILPK